MENQDPLTNLKALTFDVFGTVVDWRGSVAQEIKFLGNQRGFTLNWENFADRWRSGYGPAMDKVRSGEIPWTNIDTLHRMILESLLGEFGVTNLSDDDKDYLNHVWHRLNPWEDSVEGLTLLKEDYIISSLSNGNVALLVNMAKYAKLPWDTVLSAELVRHYKPDPETYLSTANFFGISISQVMMVAAHKNDLKAARSNGMRTAYVPRPLEHGPNTKTDESPEEYIDIIAKDFIDLSRKLKIVSGSNQT